MHAMQKVLTYDTTLRDGEQSEGVTLSLEDKLRIAHRLDEFGGIMDELSFIAATLFTAPMLVWNIVITLVIFIACRNLLNNTQ